MKQTPSVFEQLEGLIRPHQSLILLQQLHILTAEGRINQDSRRKLKQVMHLAQFIERLLPLNSDSHTQPSTESTSADFTLVDLGAGKSYLGFILYDLFLQHMDWTKVYAVEMRQELVAQTQALQQKLGFSRFDVLHASVAEATTHPLIPQHVHIVTALHACDTATDDAIAFALAKSAKHMVLVPCCQAQVAGFLRKQKSTPEGVNSLAELWRHPMHTREFGSHLTNVLRCLYLESQGYRVTVTELVGWEHSMKNELIIASKHSKQNLHARSRLVSLLKETALMPILGERFGFTNAH